MKDKFSKIWGDLSNKVGVTTISKCSYGGPTGREEVLVNSTRKVIKFDPEDVPIGDSAVEALISDWLREWNEKGWDKAFPKGVDCLYVEDGTLFLVEFKNQDKIDNKKVGEKIHDTVSLLSRFYSLEPSDFSFIEIILVRKFKPTRENRRHYEKKANESPKFSTHLDFLQKVYQTKISVLSSTDYEKLINTPNDSEVLTCIQ